MSARPKATGRDRRRFPKLKEELPISEDPARWLDCNFRNREFGIEARIRGIDYLAVLRAWKAVERRLGRGPGGGPRGRVMELLEEREAWLLEHGDRWERGVTREEAREIIEEQRRRAEEAEDVESSYRHDECGEDVEKRGERSFFCPSCEISVPRSAITEVLEPGEGSA